MYLIAGWRDELLPVVASFSGEPVLLMERAAVPWFGMKAYGVHINGYVRDLVTNEILLWVAKRSKTKSTFPGMSTSEGRAITSREGSSYYANIRQHSARISCIEFFIALLHQCPRMTIG